MAHLMEAEAPVIVLFRFLNMKSRIHQRGHDVAAHRQSTYLRIDLKDQETEKIMGKCAQRRHAKKENKRTIKEIPH